MKRIQRRRTKGWQMPEGTMYVGRPSRWGNPWRAGLNHDDLSSNFSLTREEAVSMFRQMWTTFSVSAIEQDLAPLRGRDLACWCPLSYPDGTIVPCHADVLLELANGSQDG